jgi:hypothetical protein
MLEQDPSAVIEGYVAVGTEPQEADDHWVCATCFNDFATELGWVIVPSSNDAKADGLPLAVDPRAVSADPTEPAFVARPPDAPVYHGFVILDGVEFEGFRLGTITELGPHTYGDAFIIAPDETRAGVVWEVGQSSEVGEVVPLEDGRWGVWAVQLPLPMSSVEAAQANLETIVPRLRHKWEDWRAGRPADG